MTRSLAVVAVLAVPAVAAGHPFVERDVAGGIDLSAGWTCRVGEGPPAGCNDVELPAAPRAFRVWMERRIAFLPGQSLPEALSLGTFATPTRVRINAGPWVSFAPGLVVLRSPAFEPRADNRVTVETTVSRYRRRPAWDGVARAGRLGNRTAGTQRARSHPGTRRPYVVQIPDGFDETRPAPLIVALHPWGVGPYAYVGTELARRAAQSGIVLLMPDGLGNSLWVGDAEDEALRAIDAVATQIPIDPDRIYLFGASMGGAGATTIGYRHPDRFAAVASFFGDSRYETRGYTAAILETPEAVRAASALYFAENARNLPTLLVHGRLDVVSAPQQTTLLADRLTALGLLQETVLRDDRGHEQRLVDEETARMLAFFAAHPRVARPARVSLRAVAPGTRRAYWLTIVPQAPGWAFADVRIDPASNTVQVLGRENVRRIVIDRSRAPLVEGQPVTAPPEVLGNEPGPLHPPPGRS